MGTSALLRVDTDRRFGARSEFETASSGASFRAHPVRRGQPL